MQNLTYDFTINIPVFFAVGALFLTFSRFSFRVIRGIDAIEKIASKVEQHEIDIAVIKNHVGIN